MFRDRSATLFEVAIETKIGCKFFMLMLSDGRCVNLGCHGHNWCELQAEKRCFGNGFPFSSAT